MWFKLKYCRTRSIHCFASCVEVKWVWDPSFFSCFWFNLTRGCRIECAHCNDVTTYDFASVTIVDYCLIVVVLMLVTQRLQVASRCGVYEMLRHTKYIGIYWNNEFIPLASDYWLVKCDYLVIRFIIFSLVCLLNRCRRRLWGKLKVRGDEA